MRNFRFLRANKDYLESDKSSSGTPMVYWRVYAWPQAEPCGRGGGLLDRKGCGVESEATGLAKFWRKQLL